MNTKDRQNMFIPIVFFLLIGGIFVGTEIAKPETVYIESHEQCAKYFSDDDNDGQNGFIEDDSCWDYPYADGSGESYNGESQDPNNNYQIYWDLHVDLVRYFIDNECNSQLNNCLGTNFITEVQFFCWFEQNIMLNDFFSIYDRAFNQIQTVADDGSIQIYTSVCLAFPSSNQPSTLTDGGTQASNPIAENPSGSSSGGGMK